MRNLFFALVLANLAFAAWHLWFAPGPPRASRTEDADVPSITLVSEIPADLRGARAVDGGGLSPDEQGAAPTRVASTPAASAESQRASLPSTRSPATDASLAAAAGSRCISVGPFRELSQAATAAANLRTAGYQPAQRVAEGDIWIGYWVYIDAIPTTAEANEILAKVRASGVTDSYVIPNSDSGSLVSLGVFSEIRGVSRRREEMRALGYEPKVVDRTRRATVYWVDVVLSGDQTLDFDALQTPGRIIRLEQRSCEPATG